MRIVSLLPSATDIMAELRLLDWLVGVSDDCDWPPQVRDKPLVARTRVDVSGMTSAEIDALVTATASQSHSLYAIEAQLLADLRPDLIITQDLCDVCAVTSGDLATACQVGCEVFSMNPHSLGDVIASVTDLATRLGVPDRGAAVADAMRAKIDQVSCAVVGLARPRVFVAEWTDPPYTSGHWVPEMVEAAGGINTLSSPGAYSVPTTWEAVLAAEPDLILLAPCGFNFARAMMRAADLSLPARTVIVDGDAHFSRPGPRLADGVRQLGWLLHPHAVPDPGLPYAELPLGGRAEAAPMRAP